MGIDSYTHPPRKRAVNASASPIGPRFLRIIRIFDPYELNFLMFFNDLFSG